MILLIIILFYWIIGSIIDFIWKAYLVIKTDNSLWWKGDDYDVIRILFWPALLFVLILDLLNGFFMLITKKIKVFFITVVEVYRAKRKLRNK